METVQEKKKVACDVNKVRSSNEDMKNEKLTAPNERMVKEGWGLAGHRFACFSGVDWEENTRVLENENGLKRRKVKEVIESLGEMYSGEKVLLKQF